MSNAKERRFDKLQVRTFADRTTLGTAAAELVADGLRHACETRGEARVVFACAPSQNEFLGALTEHPLPWDQITVFHMDEYVGLVEAHPQSFRRYLREHLLARIGAPKAVHFISGEQQPSQECARYTALMDEKPIDLVCLGIGENGHLAFNDPPVADFQDPQTVKVVELDLACRQQQVNDGCFSKLSDVPTHALTLTIPALLNARAISCVVPGERKARAVRDTLVRAIETACPASILRTHPNAVLHIDKAAASLLPR